MRCCPVVASTPRNLSKSDTGRFLKTAPISTRLVSAYYIFSKLATLWPETCSTVFCAFRVQMISFVVGSLIPRTNTHYFPAQLQPLPLMGTSPSCRGINPSSLQHMPDICVSSRIGSALRHLVDSRRFLSVLTHLYSQQQNLVLLPTKKVIRSGFGFAMTTYR